MISVLVIEDDKTISSLLCSIITKSGYSADSAENGLDGLDKALSGDYSIILTADEAVYISVSNPISDNEIDTVTLGIDDVDI